MRVPLKLRLMAAFTGVALVVGSGAVYTLVQLQRVDSRYRVVTQQLGPATNATTELETAITGKSLAIQSYMLYPDQRLLSRINDDNAKMAAALQKLQAFAVTQADKQSLAGLSQAAANYDAVVSQAVDLLKQNNIDRARGLMYDQGLGQSDYLILLASRMRVDYGAREKAAIDAVSSQARTTLFLAGGGVAAALLLALLLGYRMAAVMANILQRLAAATTRVAAGDLTVQSLSITRNDEVGDVAASFDQMVAHLRTVIQQARRAAAAVGAAAGELTSMAHASAQGAEGAAASVGQVAGGASQQAVTSAQVRRTMLELQQSIDQIAAGAQQTAREVSDSSALLDEVATRIERVVTQAESVATNAAGASSAARNGSAVVERTLQGIAEIRVAVGETAGRIEALGQFSGQIGTITDAISTIADQTNLLALNAAIEAARAGEHGRGFAVVAEEVRRLAENSARSAEEIGALIGQIQSSAQQAMEAMAKGTARVENGSALAAEAGRALQGIVQLVALAEGDGQAIAGEARAMRHDAERVVSAFTAVAAVTEENLAATEEMAAAAAEVTQAAEGVAAVSQENAAAAEEVSAAIEEFTAQAGEVSAAAAQLEAIAANLQGVVNGFTLESEPA